MLAYGSRVRLHGTGIAHGRHEDGMFEGRQDETGLILIRRNGHVRRYYARTGSPISGQEDQFMLDPEDLAHIMSDEPALVDL